MIQVEEINTKTIQVNLEGEITAQDYKDIKPQLETIFENRGRQKVIFNMAKVKKFDLAAIYENIKFDLQHLKYIGTTAVVSNKPFAESMTQMVNAVYPVKVERFDDLSSAETWLSTQKA